MIRPRYGRQGRVIRFDHGRDKGFESQSATMKKETYIKEFGYTILDSDEALLRLNIKINYFMKVCLFQSELPGYMWN